VVEARRVPTTSSKCLVILVSSDYDGTDLLQPSNPQNQGVVMTDKTKIHAMAVLRRNQGNHFSLVVRWLLGNGEDLPRYDDTFYVLATLLPSRRPIKADGSLGSPGEQIAIPVRPRNFAMIDPPREIEEVGETATGEKQYRLKSKKPNAPIDPMAADSGTLRIPDTHLRESYSVGVHHILQEAEPSVEAWRLAQTLQPAFRDAMKVLALNNALFAEVSDRAGAPEDFADNSVKELATRLVQQRIRPIDFPYLISFAAAQVRNTLMQAGPTETLFSGMPAIFDLSSDHLEDRIVHLALIATSLNSESLLLRADDISKERSQVRQQLRLRALQGGELIDYWCDPQQSVPSCPDSERGKRYPASELLGMGLTIPGITSTDITDYIAAGEMLSVVVKHEPGDPILRVDSSLVDRERRLGYLSFDKLQQHHWDPGQAPVLTSSNGEFQRAIDSGSSHFPPRPAGAHINYDLTQSNAGDPKAGDLNASEQRDRTVTFETGDGKVQILIQAPPAPDWAKQSDVKTVYAYNIYGMWEGEGGTERFFSDSPDEPTLDELRPWRVSSRYSYTRDLSGALLSNDGPHPALLGALSDPPWFPVLERPNVVRDPVRSEDNPDGLNKLPNVGLEGFTAWSVDLRKGMMVDHPPGISVKWDNFGPLNSEWSPELKRDNSPAEGRPQRYRFWVTSVDAFEQESDPVPVQANDEQAKEVPSWFYEPRRRSQLGPPPQSIDDDGAAGQALHLEWNDDSSQLQVNWETPFIAQVAANGSEQTQRADKSIVQAKVVIFRKRIKRVVEPSVSFQAPTIIQHQPQWKAIYMSMNERGYAEYHTEDCIDPPIVGDIWIFNKDIPWEDRDFEYVAAVGFYIRDQLASFWAPNVTSESSSTGRGRKLLTYSHNGDDFDPVISWINETPRFSDVSETKSVLASNTAEPRGVKIKSDASQGFQFAAPVLPTSQIRRDLVLLRLLTHDVKGKDPQEWSTTGVKLTEGQRVMCETAIKRTKVFGQDPYSPNLRQVRRLLAEEFAAGRKDRNLAGIISADSMRQADVLLQHATIGFRGIKTLRWSYTSFYSDKPILGKESEASAFRIYQVRVPIEFDDAAVFATFRGKARKEGPDSYRMITLDSGSQEAIDSIAKLLQPAFASWFESAHTALNQDPPPQNGLVLSVQDSDTPQPLITVNHLDDLPDEAELMVFATQPIVEIPIEEYSPQVMEYNVNLPVGGGYPEIFHWLVVTVSAQGKEAGSSRWGAYTHYAPMTIEPDPPAAFNVSVPTDRKKHVLDPKVEKNKPFLPRSIWNNDNRVLNNPRLLLSWIDSQQEARALLVVRRRQIKVNEQEGALSVAGLAEGMTSWQALKEIERVEPGQWLDPAAIAVLEETWLQGKVVVPDIEAQFLGSDPGDILIEPELGLLSAEGLIKVDDPDSPMRRRPAFVDYFYRPKGEGRHYAMEGSFLYSYSAARVIDLDPPPRIFNLGQDQRYLYSSWTSWLPFQAPGTTQFEITEIVQTPQLIDPSLSPIVEFRVATNPLGEFILADDDETPIQFRDWFYRVVIRRRIDRGMPPGDRTPFQAEWVEVAGPIRVNYNEPYISVIDDLLERTGPDDTLSLVYRISATQMAVIEDSQGRILDEVLVRRGLSEDGGEKEFEIKIPPMLWRDRQSGPRELLHEQKIVVAINLS
jgi:hypothetical protein